MPVKHQIKNGRCFGEGVDIKNKTGRESKMMIALKVLLSAGCLVAAYFCHKAAVMVEAIDSRDSAFWETVVILALGLGIGPWVWNLGSGKMGSLAKNSIARNPQPVRFRRSRKSRQPHIKHLEPFPR